jgi:hypothetical protein
LVNQSSSFSDLPMDDRISRIEQQLEQAERRIRQLMDENRQIKRNQRYFELVLIEEVRLLMRLLEKDQPRLTIHSTGTRDD